MKAYEKIGIILHQSHCSIVPENTALLFPNLLHFIFPKSLYFFFLFTAVACVFAIVLACSIFLFVTKLSGYAKTMTPSVSAPRQQGQPAPPLQICRYSREVFAVPKAMTYTDLLAIVFYLFAIHFFSDLLSKTIPPVETILYFSVLLVHS